MLCSSCGTTLGESARFCGSCGAPVMGRVPFSPHPKQSRPPRPWLAGLTPVGLLVPIGIGLGIVLGAAGLADAVADGRAAEALVLLEYLVGIGVSAAAAALWVRQYGSGPGPAPGAVGGPPGATHPSTSLVVVIGSFTVTYGAMLVLTVLLS